MTSFLTINVLKLELQRGVRTCRGRPLLYRQNGRILASTVDSWERWSSSRPKKSANKKTLHHGTKKKQWEQRRKYLRETLSPRNQLSKILSTPVTDIPPPEVDLSAQHVDLELLERRRVTVMALPFFLGRDANWREVVMDRLKEELPQPRGRKNSTTWFRDMRQWYHECIPHFRERLEADPSMIGDSLDRLAEVGFDNPDFQRNFRSVSQYRYKVARLTSEILEQEQECSNKDAAVAAKTPELNQMQAQFDELFATENSSHSDGQNKELGPLQVESAIESLKDMIFSNLRTSEPDKGHDENHAMSSDEVGKKARLLKRKLDRLMKEVKSLQDAQSRAHAKLENLREKRLSLQSPMSDEEFDIATKALESVRDDICKVLADFVTERHRVVLDRFQVLDQHTDLSRPQEWFPFARLDRRKIIFHAGPTNSGKTYNALERLKEAKKGMYLGPLRLLAGEIYEKFTAEGVYCNLYTGQEKREIPFSTHGAATVEMASMLDDFDVVVIDEIQMIADVERGFAWTRALLGTRCPEIHVCGGEEAEPILRKLAAACGDEFEIRRYERFSSLTVAEKSLANSSDEKDSYRNVEKGDCIVAFSRNDIFAIKREIERLTDFKCCVVYGSLPPQTRSEQARLFNDPDSGYDILVASDAIGMGLNLNIRRIIFNSIYKNDGSGIVKLGHSAMKQISGRAGRRNSIFPDGIITCRCPEDMAHLKWCIEKDIEPIQRAGLLPTASHLEIFDSTVRQYGQSDKETSSMYTVLKQFAELASIKNDYFLCRQTPMHDIAKAIDEYPLSIQDKYTLCMCPVSTKSPKSMEVLKRFAAKLSVGEISGLANRMVPRKAKTFEDLAFLCHIFSDVDLFLWLQNKFPPANYIEQQNALALKESAIRMIGQALQETANLRLSHCYLTRDKLVRKEWKRRNKKNQDDGDEPDAIETRDVIDAEESDWNRMVPDI